MRCVTIGVIALHLAASWLPEESAWSVWPYTTLPLPAAWGAAIGVLLLTITPLNDLVRDGLRRLWCILPGTSRPNRWFVLVALLSGGLFWWWRIRHLGWGDAAFIVKALEYTGEDRPIWTIYNWQSPLTIFLHARLWLWLNPVFTVGVDTLYAVTSVLAGIAFVYVLLHLADQLGRDHLEKWLIFGMVATTGAMQLFFGYVENYTLMSAGLMLTLYLSVRCLHAELNLAWSSTALAITNAFHPSTVVMWPAMFLIAWWKVREQKLAKKDPKYLWGALIVPPLLIFVALASFMTFGGHGVTALLSDDRPGGADGIPFVPLYRIETPWQHYTMFSLAHLLDWANEHFLISPFGFFLLAYGLILGVRRRLSTTSPYRDPQERGTLWFLIIASTAYLIWTFVWNPDYGGRKDWDLFAPSAFVYTLLASYAWTRQASTPDGNPQDRIVLARHALLLIAASGLHTGAWIYSNTLPR
ncbi:MAG: hypothetical protein NZ765_10690 [Anaerolineae bacterium]|nr:hypothetical protein [Anaerolineae bacterium]MDW8072088.1 hypothetical protein [Anaerolineae bacterium]